MCPACLASIAVLLSGGAFSGWLVLTSRPRKTDVDFPPHDPNGEDHEQSEDRLAR
jgi:hypothetical protein